MKTLLGIPVSELDTSKYIMQLRGVIHWKKHWGKGTIEWATGVGKSMVAYLAIYAMRKVNPSVKCIIIVPTTQLKGQWEENLLKLGLAESAEVYVVNTVALKDKVYQCDLLVVDEVHRVAADKFSRIFQLVQYKHILGLTATIDRLDGKEKLLKKYAPVVSRVTQTQARRKGWISDFIEMNVPIHISRDEKESLSNMNRVIAKNMAKFDDHECMRRCMKLEEAEYFAQLSFPSSNYKEMGAQLQVAALQAQQFIAMRTDFLYNLEQKIAATVELINEFGLKTITFSQSTRFADEVKNRVGPKAVAYHTKIEPVMRQVEKSKVYKSANGASKFLSKKPGAKQRMVEDGFEVYWKEPKKIGITVLKREALDHFSHNKNGVSAICTARALDQGFDVRDIGLGINASFSSNPTQYIQRSGRTCRPFTYTDGTIQQAVFINLFVPNSKDQTWLENAQKGSRNVVYVDDVKEAISLIKKRLKS